VRYAGDATDQVAIAVAAAPQPQAVIVGHG
jgi:hypothetical protein